MTSFLNSIHLTYFFGGLGLFLYGMRLMTETSLEAFGEKLKKFVTFKNTNERLKGASYGLIASFLSESVMAISTMLVSLVTTNFITFRQSLGIIIGLNIGGSAMIWFLAANIGQNALAFFSFGLFSFFFGKYSKNMGELGKILFFLGLVLFGHALVTESFVSIAADRQWELPLLFLKDNIFTLLIWGVLSCFITILVSSPLFVLGLIISLSFTDVLSFRLLAGMVMGVNIGGALKILLTTRSENYTGKKIAYAHVLFNIVGLLIILINLDFFVKLVTRFSPNSISTAYQLAGFHTFFNFLSAIILIPSIKYFEMAVLKLAPDLERKQRRLVHFGKTIEIIPSAAIVQLEREVDKLQDIVGRMFNLARDYIGEEQGKAQVLAKIKKYENITDNIHREVALFVHRLIQRPLNKRQSLKAQYYVRASVELENIADQIDKIATYYTKINRKESLTKELKEELEQMIEEVLLFYRDISENVINGISKDKMEAYHEHSQVLKEKIDKIRVKHAERILIDRYGPLTSLIYSDMILSLRKIRGHARNMAQLLSHIETY